MEKRKRWHRLLIFGVLLLTLYNIFPTIFFSSKPLKNQIDETQASKISSQIMQRVNRLEMEAKGWLTAFCKQLNLKAQSIAIDPENPQHIALTFKNTQDANTFRKHLPRAGSLIPFVPNQLSLFEPDETISKTVVVQRKIPLQFSNSDTEAYFQFSDKFDKNGSPTPLYRALIFDRILQMAMAIGGPSENAKLVQTAISSPSAAERQDLATRLSQDLLAFVNVFGENDVAAKRYFSSFSQIETENRDTFIQNFLHSVEQTKDQVKLDRISLQSEAQSLQAKGNFLETEKQQQLEQLLAQEKVLDRAESLIRKHKLTFATGKTPLTFENLNAKLESSFLVAQEEHSKLQILNFEGRNSFIQKMTVDWGAETIELSLYPDLVSFKDRLAAKGKHSLKEQVNQFIFNEIAYDSRHSGEQINPLGANFLVKLNRLEGSHSFLAMRLSKIAEGKTGELTQTLLSHWHPKHPDLVRENFPIWDYQTYSKLPKHEQKLGLVVYAPATLTEIPKNDLRNSSIYVIAKGLDKILQKLQANPQSEDSKQFFNDFTALKNLLQRNGLFGYPGTTLTTSKDLANDFIFEAEDFYLPTISATREDFTVNGTKRFAVLEFTNLDQRILAQNKISNQTHEDLLKWRDDYRAAQLGLGGASTYDVPKPIHNVLLNNLKLSWKKYFAGDDRKVLHWGLDLSGGKTVQIELRDQNHRLVTNEDEINQGINELYHRVNKMGVSEVSIRREGHCITLDFPGTQGLSANELIKSSTMYFHLVNERNPALASSSEQFLQDIWNEAVVTGRKSAEEINQIAWRH